MKKEIKPNRVLDERILSYYINEPWGPWIDEGIDWKTQKEFGVGFDLETGRVIFPVRNRFGELIGVKGRTVVGDEAKYLYLYECNKSIELFNLDKALPYIDDKKEVIVFEGAKSVMKAWSYGYKNCVSIEGDSITDEQIQLLKELGIEINIVLAFDKDKSEEWVKDSIVRRITNRNVYMIHDFFDFLDEKDAPVDKGKEVWEELYKGMYKVRSIHDLQIHSGEMEMIS